MEPHLLCRKLFTFGLVLTRDIKLFQDDWGFDMLKYFQHHRILVEPLADLYFWIGMTIAPVRSGDCLAL
jgi:hypothetical protein